MHRACVQVHFLRRSFIFSRISTIERKKNETKIMTHTFSHRESIIVLASMKNNPKYVHAYGWNRFNMMTIGVWPETDDNFIRRNCAWVYAISTFLLIWIPQFTSVTVFWGNLNAVIDCLSINVPVAVSIMKLLVFRYQREVLIELLGLIEADWAVSWTKEEEETMLVSTKISRMISLFSVSVTSGMFVIYTILTVWLGWQDLHDPNFDQRLSVGMLYTSVFPYDTKKLKWFIPTWIGQLATTWISMMSYSGPDAFVAMFVLHLCGKLAVVKLNLRNIVDEASLTNPRVFWQKLTAIVKMHEEINRRNELMEKALNGMLLAQMLVCTITFCCQGFGMFTAVMESEGSFPVLGMIFFVVHAVHTVVHLFVYCWVGDVLIVESSAIGFSPYESNWYLLNSDQVKALMFVTHRSRTPLQLTAGKFCSFSLELFTGIMKTSMGYLSMLLAMKDRLVE